MRKRPSVLLTLIISLFVFCGRVEAAKELTCVYETNGWRDYMIIQNDDGKIDFYTLEYYDGTPSFNSEGWNLYSPDKIDEISYDDTEKYNGDFLTSCPEYLEHNSCRGFLCLEEWQLFSFSDNKGSSVLVNDNSFVEDDIPSVDDNYPHISIDTNEFLSDYISDYWEIVGNTEWSAECTYYSTFDSIKIYLYFNDERYILINESDSIRYNYLKFTIDDLNKYFKEILFNCPPRIYAVPYTQNRNPGNYEFHYYIAKPDTLNAVYSYSNMDNKVNVYRPEPDEPIDITDCRTLLGEDIISKINYIMDVVKIFIPILLIVFGIVDFTKAIFVGKSDDMAKSQKTFIKRIVAAFLVFIAPLFVNLVLDLANEVWSNISADNCINVNK